MVAAAKSWKRCVHAGIPFLGSAGDYRGFRLLRPTPGIPLTHRDYAQSVRLVTGHLKTGGELDWENLAAEKQTLVFYMGLNQAATIQEKLIAFGMQADMPVALVENGIPL
ncbi:siroheme synthase [Salmonella enterica subsp. enterica]|nr:siroheme synthase [Salmonella enterica subsp. enterica]